MDTTRKQLLINTVIAHALVIATLVYAYYVTGGLATYMLPYAYVVIGIESVTAWLYATHISEYMMRRAEKRAGTRIYRSSEVVPEKLVYAQTAILHTITYTLVALTWGTVLGITPLEETATALVLLLGVSVLVLEADTIYTYTKISSRKTASEIEFPFLLAYMDVLSNTHLSLYNILVEIKRSKALKQWSRDVETAEKISELTGVSTVFVFLEMMRRHPSEKIRHVMTRIVESFLRIGDAGRVVSRGLEQAYMYLMSRLDRLVDKIDILAGVFIVVPFTGITIMVSLVPFFPSYYELAVNTLITTMTITSLAVYVLATHIYPDALSTKPSTKTKAVSLTVLTAIALVLAQALRVGTLDTCIAGVLCGKEYLLATITALLLVAVAVSEHDYRKTRKYDELMDILVDAVEAYGATGENIAVFLEKNGHMKNELVRQLVKTLRGEADIDALVYGAPTLLHASFIEAMHRGITLGTKPEELIRIADKYLRLRNMKTRISNATRMLEIMIILLFALVSLFNTYMLYTYRDYEKTVMEMGRTGVHYPFMIGMGVAESVIETADVIALLSIIITSFIAGKLRTGSGIYGWRTALIAILVYVAVEKLGTGMLMFF